MLRVPIRASALSPLCSARLSARLLSGAPKKVDTALVKELRVRTSAAMKKCVEALQAAGGADVEAAIAWLRKAGVASASKKASRDANEGAVVLTQRDDALALVEVNSETDFVSRNDVFQSLARAVAESSLELSVPRGSAPADEASMLAHLSPDAISATILHGSSNETVSEAVGVAISQLGENIRVRRASTLSLPRRGALCGYVHNTYAPGLGRTAAAVALLSPTADVEGMRALGSMIAMHVVAASPLALRREEVDKSEIEREIVILTEQAEASGKAPAVVQKMVQGRLNKFYQEKALLEQTYVVDDKAGSIQKVLDAAAKSLGGDITLAGYIRYQVGEEA